MHSHDMDITLDNLSKIEGHGKLVVKVRKGKIENLQFRITEHKRFYTKAVEGKRFLAAPQLMSRICGTCSIAHLLCCIEAIEDALGVQPTKQTQLLRKLTLYGLNIRDHALHLYIFSLPDVFMKDSILEFDEHDELQHQLVHDCFEIKAAGNFLSKIVAGRAVHAPFPMVGGYTKAPSQEEIHASIKQLQNIRQKIFTLMEVFAQWDRKLERDTNHVALVTDDYSFMGGEIQTSKGTCIKPGFYGDYLKKVVIPYSTATGYNFQGENYLVGALARLNLNRDALHENTRTDAKKYLTFFPSLNIYHHNLGQAIEILHCIDHSIEILKHAKFEKARPIIPKPRKSSGIGVLEAPRGTLYYKVDIDEKGVITHADVIVPTQQNQINIELDIKKFVEENLDMDKEEMALEIEKIIRAYDPCMSCATHFLKVRWV